MRNLRRLPSLVTLAGLCLSLVSILTQPSTPPAAAQEAKTDISFRDLQHDDQSLHGFNPTFDVWVTPPGGRLAGDATLQLFFAPSPLLGPPSSMTISVNNGGVWSGSLDNLGAARQSLKVPLPRELLRTDLNRVSLQFLLRLQDDDCRTPDNAARYITLFRDSFLSFEPSESDTAVPDLLRFPLPFIGGSTSGAPTPINVIVPPSPSREHFTAAAQFAARIGRNASTRTPPLVLLTSTAVTPEELATGHVVLVGTPPEIPLFAETDADLPIRWKPGPNGGWASAEGIDVDPHDGLVALGRSPWNRDRGLLVITGASTEGVAKAGAALGAGNVGGFAAGKVAVVPLLPALHGGPSTLRNSLAFTLADLGHRSTTLSGQGSHRFGVTFTAGMPDPTKASTIDVLTIHSSIMDVERSSTAVSINGTSVGSSSLDAGTAGLGRARLNLPAGLVRPGVNNLSIDFTLYLPQQSECGPLAEERAWVSLLSTSSVSVPQVSGAALDLEAYPYPFVHNRAINGVTLLLPDALDERGAALGPAAELGRWAQQDASTLIAGTRSQFTDTELAQNHIILFGTPAGNPAVSEAAPRIVSRLLDRTRPLERLGLIALAPSHWRADHAMLLVSGAGPDLLTPATNALASRNLSGTARFVTTDGRPIPVPAALEPTTPASSSEPQRPTLSPILIAAIVVGVLTLGAIVLGSIRHD